MQFLKNKTRIQMNVKISGESLLLRLVNCPILFPKRCKQSGCEPEMSTTGGTSDARFVKICPVTEFGLVGKTMHAVDERVEIAQIHQLKSIYGRI